MTIMHRLLGQEVTVTIDNPINSNNNGISDKPFPVNFGYISDAFNEEGEAVKAYVIGVNIPLESFNGRVIALIFRNQENEFLVVVAPVNMIFTKDAIKKLTHFQEQYYDVDYIFERKGN